VNWLRKIFILLNWIASLMLAATLLNRWVSAHQIWFLSFLGLGFPYLLITNFLFFIGWIFAKKWWFLISFFSILINFKNIKSSVAFHTNIDQTNVSDCIKVMSFNVRVFDLYEYDENKNNLNRMIDFIKSNHPHIICIQEFYCSESYKQKPYNTIKRLTDSVGYKYFHFYNSSTLRQTDHWGMAIFSDFPIKQSADIDFGIHTENAACYSDIEIQNKIYRIINTHLQSVYFGRRDYQYLDNIKLEDDKDINAGKRILRKLKRGYVRRANQADRVSKLVDESPYPIILCGDFNDTPASYAYHTIGKNLNDNFLQSGFGFGSTYVSRFPFLRIDYIFTDKKIKIKKFETLNQRALSDHYPIMSWLNLNSINQ
jgi:endonuclease/exonuclease/phosphatase family metal-dependent hydrolase